ncbi:MAG: hypothetical protein RIE86_08285, partial [Imperialibacter sp.]
MNDSEDNSLVISGTSSGTTDQILITVTISDGVNTVQTTAVVGAIWSAIAVDLTTGPITPGSGITVDATTDGTVLNAVQRTFDYDITAPTISITSNATISDGYLNATEDDAVLTISGTTSGAEDGQVVTLTLNSLTYTSTGGGNVTGNAWSVVIPAVALQALTDATTYSIDADVNDAAGNPATPANSGNFEYDITVPTISITPNATISDGYLNATEDDSDLTISGTTSGAEDGQVVTLTLNSLTYTSTGLGNVTANAWTVVIPSAALSALTDGVTYSIDADVTDAAGNPAITANSGDFVYDISAVVSITSNATISDGYLNAAEDDSDLTLNGSSSGIELGTVVSVTLNSVSYLSSDLGNSDIDGSGNWQIIVPLADLQLLTDGVTYSITASASDLAGNTANDNSGNFDYDISAPTISITANATISDGFLNATEDDSDLTISGTTSGAEDGQVVTLTLNSLTYTSTGGGNVTGNAWSVVIPAAALQALTDATTYSIDADVNDAAGNPATPANSGNFEYDITVPTISITPNATISDGYLNATEDDSDLTI